MRHNATILYIGIVFMIDIARNPIIDDALVTMIDIVLAAIVNGSLERKLVARSVGWTEGGEIELVTFGVVVFEGMRVLIAYVKRCSFVIISKGGERRCWWRRTYGHESRRRFSG